MVDIQIILHLFFQDGDLIPVRVKDAVALTPYLTSAKDSVYCRYAGKIRRHFGKFFPAIITNTAPEGFMVKFIEDGVEQATPVFDIFRNV